MNAQTKSTKATTKPADATTVLEDAPVTLTKPAELVRTMPGDMINVKTTSNNILLGTWKTKSQAEISLGLEQRDLTPETILPVTISKTLRNGETIQKTFNANLLYLLVAASNGIFEVVNTNAETAEQFNDLMEAMENGFFYVRSFAAYNKKEPWSVAKFIARINKETEPNGTLADNAEKWNKTKAQYRTTRDMESFLIAMWKNYGAKFWLYPLMEEAGFTLPEELNEAIPEDLL